MDIGMRVASGSNSESWIFESSLRILQFELCASGGTALCEMVKVNKLSTLISGGVLLRKSSALRGILT